VTACESTPLPLRRERPLPTAGPCCAWLAIKQVRELESILTVFGEKDSEACKQQLSQEHKRLCDSMKQHECARRNPETRSSSSAEHLPHPGLSAVLPACNFPVQSLCVCLSDGRRRNSVDPAAMARASKALESLTDRATDWSDEQGSPGAASSSSPAGKPALDLSRLPESGGAESPPPRPTSAGQTEAKKERAAMQATLLMRVSELQGSSVRLVEKIDTVRDHLRSIPKTVELLSSTGDIAK
jgi:hypothetical protein